ncbi:DUF1045 domain-containing protein [Gymnodinialimonas ceratoperidinii]|uniref:DUF1045 domain-containing protein n=1 Tax=Gymnodinialimonas ceratoperidinii TaxID=2856823 RepID=A0A8F6TZ79_9RHOB|nr:DUF1045 domain-containing protein [Gymnodinialimonas ceratoperidinii]QXT41173.1 DUF1045 domain-containing protein [Gymnodinialimonas ceratoperidinii]
MDGFKRYGLYVVPEGALYAAGAALLGWDSAAGAPLEQPAIAGLPESAETLTATPRKYGFHGTIKPPFALAEGSDAAGLSDAARAFCAGRAPVNIPRLEVRRMGGFVALVPAAPSTELSDLAGAAVAALDPFRAPPSASELARRRKAGLTETQEALLQKWGYPFVMEAFRFHMTLTGRTPHADAVRDALTQYLAPTVPQPFVIDSLALMGEDDKGFFHLLHRYPLSG